MDREITPEEFSNLVKRGITEDQDWALASLRAMNCPLNERAAWMEIFMSVIDNFTERKQ